MDNGAVKLTEDDQQSRSEGDTHSMESGPKKGE